MTKNIFPSLLPKAKKISFNDFDKPFNFFEYQTLTIPKDSSRRLKETFFKFIKYCNDNLNISLNISLDQTEKNGIKFLKETSEQNNIDYIIKVEQQSIIISAHSEDNLFYSLQTLKQLLTHYNGCIPALIIEDACDYKVRGFYHDVTRGKVPTLKTLFELVDKLAYYKINQLQLYVEYTHQFKNHIDLWGGSNALSNEDILKLDQYCYDNFIELVPSLSCFGHMYKVLRSQRKQHLNELNVNGSEYALSQRDRMWHYTLDAKNIEAYNFVTELITEYSQLFRSNKFNICCDETFDLGMGKNADEGDKGKLYVNFLNKIISHVLKLDKTPMLWGDVIINYPELIEQIPKNIIFLNWDYSDDGKERPCEVFKQHNCKYYGCPSVQGWNQFISNIQLATNNITSLAKIGLKNKADGLLITNWGDYCHINPLSSSFYGLVLGATKGWNCNANFSVVDFMNFEYDINDPKIANELFELQTIAGLLPKRLFWTWCDLFTGSVDYPQPYRVLPIEIPKAIIERLNFKEIAKDYQTSVEILNQFTNLLAKIKVTSNNKIALKELFFSFKGTKMMLETMFGIAAIAHNKTQNNDLKLPNKYQIADNIRLIENEFSEIWHLRNRPSEYYVIKTLFLDTADFLERSNLP